MPDAPPLPPDADGIEPADGDLVVVRASVAPDGEPVPTADAGWAVIEWGSFRLLGGDAVPFPLDVARAEARLQAAQRRRSAWDSSGPRLQRLRRVPLISARPGHTYWLTADITDVADARAVTRWQSHFHLTEAQALALLGEHGFPEPFAATLLASARADAKSDH